MTLRTQLLEVTCFQLSKKKGNLAAWGMELFFGLIGRFGRLGLGVLLVVIIDFSLLGVASASAPAPASASVVKPPLTVGWKGLIAL